MLHKQHDIESYIQKVKFYGAYKGQSQSLRIKAQQFCQRNLHDYVTFKLEGNLDDIRHLIHSKGVIFISQNEMKSLITYLKQPYFFKIKLYLSHILHEMSVDKTRGEAFASCHIQPEFILKNDIVIHKDNLDKFKSYLRLAMMKSSL